MHFQEVLLTWSENWEAVGRTGSHCPSSGGVCVLQLARLPGLAWCLCTSVFETVQFLLALPHLPVL